MRGDEKEGDEKGTMRRRGDEMNGRGRSGCGG